MAAQMTVAELVARLRMDNSQFTRGMRDADKELDRFDAHTSKTARGLMRLGQQFDALAVGLSTTAGIVTASLVRVGVNYNTLLQKTNAAFKTLLGSAEQAAVMQEKLTAFTRESPFPRQIFVQGTQQLLGFGLAAEKVIPAFQAIEDAVAATGGGAQEIQSFVDTFAQIKSMGRANTEQLMRFSFVGVDAFKVLAKQAGVSIGEMRKRVTEGAMGADDTIRMLTEGLTERFDGAAADVKKTWVGTKDRIAAAWRDMGSKLVAPFVSPTGGGAAVEWGNKLADLMRELEREVVPPLAERITDLIDRFSAFVEGVDVVEIVDRLRGLFSDLKDELGGLLPVVAGVGAGFTKAGIGMLPFGDQLTRFIPLPGKLLGALLGLTLGTEEGRAALVSFGDALKDALGGVLVTILPALQDLAEQAAELVPPLIEVAEIVLNTAWPVFAAGLEISIEMLTGVLAVLQPLVDLLAENEILVRALMAAWVAFNIPKLASEITRLAGTLRAWATAQTAVNVATAASGTIATGSAAAGIGAQMGRAVVQSSALLGVMGKLQIAFAALKAIALPAALVIGFMEVMGAIADSKRALAEFKTSLREDIGQLPIEDKLDEIERRIRAINNNQDLSPSPLGGVSGGAPRHGGFLGAAEGWWDRNVVRRMPWDQRDEAEKEARRFRREVEYNIGATNLLTKAWQRFSAAAESGISRAANGVQGMTNTAAQAILNLEGLQESIGEFAAPLDEAWGNYTSPMTIWSSSTSAAAGGVGALAKSQNDAKREAMAYEDAQRAVNEVMERQFDAMESARNAVQGLANAYRAQIDPVFAMMDALQRRQDMFAGSQVGPDKDKPLSFTNRSGSTLLDLARANTEVDTAGMALVAAVQSGQVTLDGLNQMVADWVARGQFTQEEGAAFMRQVQDALSAAEAAQGAIGPAVQAQVDQDKSAFDAQQMRDLAQAQMAVVDALDAMNQSAGGAAGGVGKVRKSLGELMDEMQKRLGEMRAWNDNIKKIMERGGADIAAEVASWGPEAAPLVAEIANATEPEFERFVSLVDEQAEMSTNALSAQLVLMQEIAEEAGVNTVSELEEHLGVMPGTVEQIALEAKDDFGAAMQTLAALAAEKGKLTSLELADKLVTTLGGKKSEWLRVILEYVDLLDPLSNKLDDILRQWQVITDQVIAIAPTLDDPKTYVGPNALPALADGGIVTFATGGFNENHVAQIARGTMRLWAEPETGGEAYIPLALSKRARSMSILRQVAGMFGQSMIPGDAEDFYGNGGATVVQQGDTKSANFDLTVIHQGPDPGVDGALRKLEGMAYRAGWSD